MYVLGDFFNKLLILNKNIKMVLYLIWLCKCVNVKVIIFEYSILFCILIY